MLFNDKTDTKEVIISTLSKGPLASTKLQELVSTAQKITKQAFYKALRELVHKEVIIKNKQSVMLNNVWISQLHDFISFTDKSYTLENKDLLNLQDGESIVHYFNSLDSLNKLWMHYFFIAAKNFPSENIIFYNRHDFWMLFRSEAENTMFKWIKQNQRKAYLVIGDTTDLDRATTEDLKKFDTEIHFEPKSSFEENHYSLTVIGDYVIDTTLDLNTAKQIDGLYKKHRAWNESVAKELDIIMSRLKRSKIVIKKDAKKAERIKKKLMKYFMFY